MKLDERVKHALTVNLTADDVAEVRDATERALAEATIKADAADAESLSPLVSKQDADKLRATASELRFEADRLEASVALLGARVADLREQEVGCADQVEWEAARAEAAALGAEMADRYPVLAAELASLIERTIASNTRCAKAKGPWIDRAEMIGRKRSHAATMSPSIIDIRLPAAIDSPWDMIWPRPEARVASDMPNVFRQPTLRLVPDEAA